MAAGGDGPGAQAFPRWLAAQESSFFGLANKWTGPHFAVLQHHCLQLYRVNELELECPIGHASAALRRRPQLPSGEAAALALRVEACGHAIYLICASVQAREEWYSALESVIPRKACAAEQTTSWDAQPTGSRDSGMDSTACGSVFEGIVLCSSPVAVGADQRAEADSAERRHWRRRYCRVTRHGSLECFGVNLVACVSLKSRESHIVLEEAPAFRTLSPRFGRKCTEHLTVDALPTNALQGSDVNPVAKKASSREQPLSERLARDLADKSGEARSVMGPKSPPKEQASEEAEPPDQTSCVAQTGQGASLAAGQLDSALSRPPPSSASPQTQARHSLFQLHTDRSAQKSTSVPATPPSGTSTPSASPTGSHTAGGTVFARRINSAGPSETWAKRTRRRNSLQRRKPGSGRHGSDSGDGSGPEVPSGTSRASGERSVEPLYPETRLTFDSLYPFTVAGGIKTMDVTLFPLERANAPRSGFWRKVSFPLSVTIGAANEDERHLCTSEIQSYIGTCQREADMVRRRSTEPASILCKSWMMMRITKAFGGWKRRFCVLLSSKELVYYKNEVDGSRYSVIDLAKHDTVSVRLCDITVGSDCTKALELRVRKRLFHFYPCTSDDGSSELQEWLTAVNELLVSARYLPIHADHSSQPNLAQANQGSVDAPVATHTKFAANSAEAAIPADLRNSPVISPKRHSVRAEDDSLSLRSANKADTPAPDCEEPVLACKAAFGAGRDGEGVHRRDTAPKDLSSNESIATEELDDEVEAKSGSLQHQMPVHSGAGIDSRKARLASFQSTSSSSIDFRQSTDSLSASGAAMPHSSVPDSASAETPEAQGEQECPQGQSGGGAAFVLPSPPPLPFARLKSFSSAGSVEGAASRSSSFDAGAAANLAIPRIGFQHHRSQSGGSWEEMFSHHSFDRARTAGLSRVVERTNWQRMTGNVPIECLSLSPYSARVLAEQLTGTSQPAPAPQPVRK